MSTPSSLASLRDYVIKGHKAPGPNDPRAPKGGETTPGAWHAFGTKWERVPPSTASTSGPLKLVTWNVDGWGASAEDRLDAILSAIFALSPDLILLQELSPTNTEHLLSHPAIRAEWFCTRSRAPTEIISQATLARRARFDGALGDVHTLSLPSRYARDIIVADIRADGGTVRSMNVHLDSLAHDPSFRPGQVRMAAESIASVGGRGFISGDWNSVLPIDDGLCRENGLVDAWEATRKGEDGFTWNWDGRSKEPFPPNRLDKVALAGMRCKDIRVVEPGSLENGVDWSDHCGLYAELVVTGAKL
ncbi:hypothetical protein CspeluHIS016_0201480 [Cutaneotrichosporon spelunceum]|uniref:Endonuclease/exonuclease/phosphatase domain-containing protein n=1 Tax=Cutaneotrichosporon spelunceum TaxID=1672016 RepID=A0AAD3TRD7_9TREE|nr:hypothetical protein CspeluHIS016_0201480 [Cutaneotrichosporon spelunceum]